MPRRYFAVIAVLIALSCGGCGSKLTAPAPRKALLSTVNRFDFGESDLKEANSASRVRIGEAARIHIQVKKQDLPVLQLANAAIVSQSRGNEITMQSCTLDVTSSEGWVSLKGEMSIPKPPCVGVLRIRDARGTTLLERSVTVVE
jgi:hypothetical protein